MRRDLAKDVRVPPRGPRTRAGGARERGHCRKGRPAHLAHTHTHHCPSGPPTNMATRWARASLTCTASTVRVGYVRTMKRTAHADGWRYTTIASSLAPLLWWHARNLGPSPPRMCLDVTVRAALRTFPRYVGIIAQRRSETVENGMLAALRTGEIWPAGWETQPMSALRRPRAEITSLGRLALGSSDSARRSGTARACRRR